MASPKVFGRIALSAATAADVFASPTGGAVFTLRIVNNNAATATVKASISDTTATIQAVGDLIASGKQTIASGGFIELTGLAIESGFFMVVESDVVTVNAIAYGMEND
jgi:hypothetical protein